MLRENWRFIARVERVADIVIIIATFFLAYYSRGALLYWNANYHLQLPFGGTQLAPLKDYILVLAIALIGYGISLNMLGAYGSMRLTTVWRLTRMAVMSSLLVFVALATTLFLLKIDLSRSFIALFCILSAFLLGVERLFVLRLLRYWRRRGKNFRNVIIAGVAEQALRLAAEIRARPELGIRIRGFADLSGVKRKLKPEVFRAMNQLIPATSRSSEKGIIVYGVKELEDSLKERAIDEVIFVDVVHVMGEVEEAVLLCSEEGVRTTIVADLFSIGMVRSALSHFGGMPLIHYETPPGDRWELAVKRWIDIGASLMLLTLLSPIFLALAILIRTTTKGPVLFKQKRVGLNGRLFSLYKFRSMTADAETRKEEILGLNEMNGPVFKISNDPRITRVGRILRRYSLDELPQLWNVLRGDMSLVGPRPPMPGEVSLYERKDRRRLSMRPGLTCIWQVSGRSNISDFHSWVRLDLEYIDNWSLGQDMLLLFRTIPAVLFGAGAR